MAMKWRCVVVCLLTATVGVSSCLPARTPKGTPTRFEYQLYTHCGINGAKIGDHYYVAAHPLGDGNGNPPRGWGNPYQRGTITLTSSTTAVFTDSVGHRVEFRLDPGGFAGPGCD